MDYEPDVLQLQQFKLISAQILNNGISSMLINKEIMLAITLTITTKFQKWENELKEPLRSFIKGEELNFKQELLLKLCMYVNFYDIPHDLQINIDNSFNSLLNYINKIPHNTLDKVRQILS